MRGVLLVVVLLLTLTLGGCNVIGDIFQAGVAVGVVMVVLLIAAVAFLARKLRRRR